MSGPQGARHWEQDKEATVYIGNLDERVTDQLVWELMLQAGRIQNVHLPKDRVTQIHQGFGFVNYMTEEDADYAAKIMNQIRLYGKPIRVNKASADKQKQANDIGAELFVGNLDAMVDEKVLYETFSRFGPLVNVPKVAREDEAHGNLSKGYGFVSFGDFESSDAAIANMNGQYLMNKEISVQYAYKKDGKGERHGDEAERTLAQKAKAHGVMPTAQALPAVLFQAQPAPTIPSGPMAMLNGDGRGVPGAPNGPSGFGPPGGPPQGRPAAGLPPPPSGLPARPPSGAPAANWPPPPVMPPMGFNGPPGHPMGFVPGGMPPPGFGGPPPPQGPPGFNQGPPGFRR